MNIQHHDANKAVKRSTTSINLHSQLLLTKED